MGTEIIKVSDVGARFFSRRELACHHCGELQVNEDALRRLDVMRDILGHPIYVISGYRCPVHNAAVGGAAKSLHLTGQAFDIRADVPFASLFSAAQGAGWTGFGFYPRHMHVDNGKPRMWVG